ncbi:MAG: hypothetical protein F2934_09830 [Actinobacteria bacterium]|uniref:Unannotated protein n=1 Tax=freshwater metagenome TaxID=449393 RepID=A0A6J6PR08_9ZZZZ|nr:hypothetical protein [Actinomycetota bacterium]MSY12068.1 hypothetical protein [Actinomycetota bacterium]MSZ04230.1 hypothetical protein [Actinomycetota bacterium]MTB07411.1 hypothetical protein [Actinomycetota bacterium]
MDLGAQRYVAVRKQYRWQFTLTEHSGTVKGWFTRDAAADCGIALRPQH